ncbi:hypothetical protein HYV22_02775 [Candidatus Gottesmanbacteria bacterium]|nr:hypothetical protein [Candidatus Gottesmanbacteria bacterium]
MNILIPAFTHCNSYATDATFSMMPNERPSYNYMAVLRLKGVSSFDIEDHLLKNNGEARSYLFSNWKGLYGLPDFPDFSDPILGERLKNFPDEYRRFMAQDFESALKKYRLDYIASIGALSPDVTRQFRNLKTVFASENVFVYQIQD